MKQYKVIRIIVGVILLSTVFLAYGGAMAMLERTFVSPWIPYGIGAAAGLLLSVPLWPWWERLTGISSFPLNWACNVAFFTGVVACVLLLVNMHGASARPQQTVVATVMGKERKTRHHTRRVGRRTYTTDRVYYVYEATIRLEDGRETTLQLNADGYRRTHSGDRVHVHVARGSFGWDVVGADRSRIGISTTSTHRHSVH